MKKLIVSIISICTLLINQAFSYEMPIIDFNVDLLEKDVNSITTIYSQKIRYQPFLGKDKEHIKDKVFYSKFSGLYESIKEEVFNNYELFYHTYVSSYYSSYSIYIFKNGICIGYLINSPIEITLFKEISEIIQIKSLEKNINFLDPKYNSRDDYKTDLYENITENNIERYGILSFNAYFERVDPSAKLKRQFLFLFSFYPKELDAYLKNYLDKKINEHIEYILSPYSYDLFYFDWLKQEDYDYYNNTP